MKNESKKTSVGFRMNSELVEKVDGYAEKMGITRSAAISCIIALYFESKESIEVLGKISDLVRTDGN